MHDLTDTLLSELRLNYILNLIVDKPLETRRIFEQLTYFLFFFPLVAFVRMWITEFSTNALNILHKSLMLSRVSVSNLPSNSVFCFAIEGKSWVICFWVFGKILNKWWWHKRQQSILNMWSVSVTNYSLCGTDVPSFFVRSSHDA